MGAANAQGQWSVLLMMPDGISCARRALTPEAADKLADQLRLYAAIAREPGKCPK